MYPAEEEWAEPLPTAEPSLTEEDFQVTGAVETNRKLIRSASMTLETLHFDQTIADVTALVSRLGGYMESTRIEGESAYSSYSNERSAEFIARVPVSSFDTVQEELAQFGSVRERSENAEDVTDQYYDVQAELDALKIQQERLLTMMEQADKMEDLIALEEALTNVRTRINERTSAIRRYDGLIEYATIRLSINEVVEYSERIEKPATFGQRIAETFKGSLDFIRVGDCGGWTVRTGLWRWDRAGGSDRAAVRPCRKAPQKGCRKLGRKEINEFALRGKIFAEGVCFYSVTSAKTGEWSERGR